MGNKPTRPAVYRTRPTATLTNSSKYLKIKNRSSSRLYFVYGTQSNCRCPVCLRWLQTETIPIADVPGATVGTICVDPYGSKVEDFCSNWDCVGACILGALPSTIKVDTLFDFDEETNYTVCGGQATLTFTYDVAKREVGERQLVHPSPANRNGAIVVRKRDVAAMVIKGGIFAAQVGSLGGLCVVS